MARPHEASAHAVLERSSPVENDQLEQAPELVETWFSEPVERSLTSIEVLDIQGNPIQTGKTIFSDDPAYAAVAVPPGLAPAIYTVTYQNVSQVDGHSWSGFFTFIVLEQDGSVPAGTAFTPEGLTGGGQGYLPGVGDSYFRWMALLAATILGGAIAFHLIIARPAAGFLEEDAARQVEEGSMRTVAALALVAWLVLATSEVAHIGLLADRLGGPGRLDDILFHTRTGGLWLARQGLALAVVLAFVPALLRDRWGTGRRGTAASLLALLCTTGLLITYSLGSHAEAGGGSFWAVTSDFVHLVATAGWLGSLLLLAIAFRWTRGRLEEPDRLLYRANMLDRFSWVAAITVVLLIGTGIFNGFVQLPRLPALWETTYGRVLIAKLVLTLPLLGVAGLNAVFLKPALVDAIDAVHGRSGAQRVAGQHKPSVPARIQRLERVLPRTTIAEFLLGVAVLASVSILTQSTTADGQLRAEANEPSGVFTAAAPADDLNLALTIKPFGLGLSTFSVKITPQAGATLENVASVNLNVVFDDPNAPPSAGTTGTDLELEKTDNPALWSKEAALLTQAGDWRIKALVRRSGANVFDAETDPIQVSGVAAYLARQNVPEGKFDLPFTVVDWNIVTGGAMLTLGLGVVLIWRQRPPSWRRSVSTPLAFSGVFSMMAGVVLLFGVHTHQTGVMRNLPPRIAENQESPFIGQTIFMNNCVVCHGETGRGDGPQAARLRVPPADMTLHVPQHNDGTLFLWISEGLPLDGDKVMPAWKTILTEDERWHVVNFLREAFGSGRYEPLEPQATPAPTSTP